MDPKAPTGGAPPPGAGDTNRPAGTRARLFDYIFLLRPMILIPVWTFFLLGAHHGATAAGIDVGASRLLAGLFSFTALLGAIYIMNQIADRAADLAGNKLFLLSKGIVSARAAWIEAAALVAVSFCAALLFLPLVFSGILAASLALGAAYSFEPVRLKRRRVLDVLANAVGNGVLNTLAGWIAAGAPLAGWPSLAPYPLAVASVHLATTLADMEADSKMGFRTSGAALGISRGLFVSTALMGGAVVAAYLAGNTPALAASVLSLPFFLIPVRSVTSPARNGDALIPAKAATLIFSVAAGYLFPLYIPFLAAVILLTRLYYARRFGMSYPSLRG
ncbi:MAG: UbiA family prenyltransferase [Candidatus Krumholzibacteria bacterium]|nr:UbiA family prenyltransferase [Candidatus Krumholzibacteria bacterium]